MSAQFVLRTAKLAQASRVANSSLFVTTISGLTRLSTLSPVASGSNPAAGGRRFQSTSTNNTPQTTGTTDNKAVTEQKVGADVAVTTSEEELNAADVSGAPGTPTLRSYITMNTPYFLYISKYAIG